MLNAEEHRAEAERLLEMAGRPPHALVSVDRKNVSAEEMQHLKDAVKASFDRDDVRVVGHSHDVRIDTSPLLLAANAHATLALVDLMTFRGIQLGGGVPT